jgi:hypothetical protein
MGILSSIAERLIKPLIERTEYVSPNNAQPELARAAIVFKRGRAAPNEAEGQAVFLSAVDLLKHHDRIAADIVQRQELGSRTVGTMILDSVDGPDTDACARAALASARRALEADGHVGRFTVHPISDQSGQEWFVVLFEPAKPASSEG